MRSVCRAAWAAFAVALVLCATAASSALATPEWYSSKEKPKPEWQQAGAKLSEATAVKWKGSVQLGDEQVPAEVDCTSSGEGTVGPGAADKETSWTLSSCVAPAKAPNNKGELGKNACESVGKTVEMKDLPWSTELGLRRSIFNEMFEDGSGEPGFAAECKVDGIEVTDTCHANRLLGFTTGIANVTGGVESTFNGSGVPDLNCTVGGTGRGWIGGSQVIEATKGGKLEANAAEPTFSKVTSSEEMRGEDNLTIEDRGEKSIGGACNVTWVGTITTGGKGTVTTFIQNCSPTGSCTKIEKIEATGLPWETELVESGGVIKQKIVSSGKGTPGWAFTCTGFARDECALNVSPEIISKGPEENVFAVFSESLTKTSCKLGGSEKGVVIGELEIAPPEGTTIKAKK